MLASQLPTADAPLAPPDPLHSLPWSVQDLVRYCRAWVLNRKPFDEDGIRGLPMDRAHMLVLLDAVYADLGAEQDSPGRDLLEGAQHLLRPL